MPRRSLVLRSVAPLSAVALLTMLGNVTACLSDNAGTGGAAGSTTAAGSGPLSGASGSGATGTAGGGAGATANGSSGGSAGTGGNGGAAAVVPKICDSSLEAETMTHSTGEAVDMGWNIWAAGDISGSHSFKGGPTTITVTAKGSVVGGVWPHMKVHVAGKLAGEVDVNTDAWAPYPFKLTPSAGTADIKVEFTNDGTDDSGGDRNLYVDKVAFSENCDGAGSGSGGSAGGGNTDTTNPFAGATIYNDGGSPACSGKGSEPLLDKICSNPQGSWINGGDGGGAVSSIVGKAGSSIPVLVAYNIPNRDCGGASGGGASDSNAYKSWIDSFAGAIGSHKVAVILEPDALAHGECADDRFDTLAYAVTALKKQSGAHVYIDAGHAGWVDAGTMAGRLKSANIAAADGFSLNVSSFQTNGDSISYGSAISSQVGGKPFVIDTSRNGKGPSGSMWCNPPGRGLGSKPGSDTGNPLVHAFLWVKRPGESDGSSGECNGGPGAGQWFQSYAVELCKNAAF
jgi:endoglucanase